MTLADIVAVMSGPDRVRITKGNNELFAGYLGNLVHMAEYEALMAEEVTRIKGTVDITHKRYKELGLMQPLHPEETPNYSFSDFAVDYIPGNHIEKRGITHGRKNNDAY